MQYLINIFILIAHWNDNILVLFNWKTFMIKINFKYIFLLMTLWKCCTQYASKFGKLSRGHRTGKGQFSFQSQRKAMPKLAMCANYHTIALISHDGKVVLKILQARLQKYVSCELPDVQAGFRKGRGTRGQTANIHWITERASELQKTIYTSSSLIMLKPLNVWITTNSGNFLEMAVPDYLTCLRNLLSRSNS